MQLPWRWWLSVAAALAVLASLLLAPIGLGATHFERTLEDALHAPLFGAIAVGVLVLLRRVSLADTWLSYSSAWIVAVGLGGLGEIAQAFTGTRHAQFGDWLNDAAGAFAALAIFAMFDPRLRVSGFVQYGLVTLCVVILLAVAMPVFRAGMELRQREAQLPALLTWHTPLNPRLLTVTEASTAIMNVPSEWRRTADERALYIRPHIHSQAASPLPVRQAPLESWPGIALEEPWPRWGAYRSLLLDVINPNNEAISVILRIDDRLHAGVFTDRFNRALRIAPHQRAELVIPLDEIAHGPQKRAMDLDAIERMVIFQDGVRGAQPFYLCGLRLTL